MDKILMKTIFSKLKIPQVNYLVFQNEDLNDKEVKNNIIRTIAKLNGGSTAASSLQPPSMIFNGLALKDGVIYASDEKDRSIYRISLQ